MLEDIRRLEAFWLRIDFDREKFLRSVLHTAKKCERGFGLVGGLYFDKRDGTKSELLRYWREREHEPDTRLESLNECAKKLSEKHTAEWLAMPVGKLAMGDYWLLSAFFDVRRP